MGQVLTISTVRDTRDTSGIFVYEEEEEERASGRRRAGVMDGISSLTCVRKPRWRSRWREKERLSLSACWERTSVVSGACELRPIPGSRCKTMGPVMGYHWILCPTPCTQRPRVSASSPVLPLANPAALHRPSARVTQRQPQSPDSDHQFARHQVSNSPLRSALPSTVCFFMHRHNVVDPTEYHK